MEDKVYSFTYRCRLCDKTFTEGYTGRKLAHVFIMQTMLKLPKDAQHPGDISFHYTSDHVGIADFVGCKIE